MRRAALERDNYRCRACGTARPGGGWEVDHVVSIAKGGAVFDLENLQTLCAFPCHADKTTRDRGGTPHEPDAAWERLKAELL